MGDIIALLPSTRSAVVILIRDCLISFASMSRPLRWLAFGVITLLIVCGALLTATGLPVPLLATGSVQDKITQVSSAIYVVTLLSLALGWSLVLMAAQLMPRGARLLLLMPVIALLTSGPLTRLANTTSQASGPSATEVWLRGAQLVILVVLVVCSIAAAPPHVRKKASELRTSSFTHRFWPVAALMAGYIAAELAIVYGYVTSAEDSQTASAIAVQARYLPVILAVVVYWGSTDFIEWGQTAAASVASLTRRLHTPAVFFCVVGLIAVGFLADLLRLFSIAALLPAAGTSLVLLGAVALVALFARVDNTWPAQVPIGALLVGVAFLYVFFQIATSLVAVAAQRLPAAAINPLYTAISVSAAIALLCAALWLIVRGRMRKRAKLRAAGFYLATMALLFVALSTPQLANLFGLPVIPAMQPSVPAIKLIVLTATLVTLATLALRGRLTSALAEPFAVVLSLIMGLQVIAWFFFLVLPAFSAVSSVSVMIAALFFLVAILWDLLMSGSQVTNQASVVFPREARVLLYLGYMLISSATLVYLKSVRFVDTGQIVSQGSQSDMLESFGAIGLGLPLIAYTFVQGLARWRGTNGHGMQDAAPARDAGSRHRLPLVPMPTSAKSVIGRVGSALALIAMLLLASCAQATGTVPASGGTPTAVAQVQVATPNAPTRAPTFTAPSPIPTFTAAPRPRPTATIGVITVAVIASWPSPVLMRPETGTRLRASSVANDQATYSTTVQVQFDVGFGPPDLILQLDYYHASGAWTKLTTLASGTPKVVQLTLPCVQNQTYLQAEALVFHVSGIPDGQSERTSTQVSLLLDTSSCSSTQPSPPPEAAPIGLAIAESGRTHHQLDDFRRPGRSSGPEHISQQSGGDVSRRVMACGV